MKRNLIFLAEKCTVGAVGTVAVPTNRFVGAAGVIRCPYKSVICSHPFVGAAGKTAPTKGYKPPLKNDSIVVNPVAGPERMSLSLPT